MGLVNISDWKVHNTGEVGPLMYVDRFNGGAQAFYFSKKDNTMVVKRRGVYTPHAYVEHDGGRKDKQTGEFYLFHCTNGDFFCRVEDAKQYLPADLPAECVDCDGFEDASDEADIAIQSFIYELDTNSKDVKIITDGDLDNFDSVNKITLFDLYNEIEVVTIKREVVDRKNTFVFLVDLKIGREEFRYKRDILTVNDFTKALSATVSALCEYPTFRYIADDLEKYL